MFLCRDSSYLFGCPYFSHANAYAFLTEMPQITWHHFRRKPAKQIGELQIVQDKIVGSGCQVSKSHENFWPELPTSTVIYNLKLIFWSHFLWLASDPSQATHSWVCLWVCAPSLTCGWTRSICQWESHPTPPAPQQWVGWEPTQGHRWKPFCLPRMKRLLLLASFPPKCLYSVVRK